VREGAGCPSTGPSFLPVLPLIQSPPCNSPGPAVTSPRSCFYNPHHSQCPARGKCPDGCLGPGLGANDSPTLSVDRQGGGVRPS